MQITIDKDLYHLTMITKLLALHKSRNRFYNDFWPCKLPGHLQNVLKTFLGRAHCFIELS